MIEIVEIALSVSMFTFIAGTMTTVGLGLTFSQIIEPFKDKKMVLLSLISNFVIVPLFAYGIVWLIPVSEGVKIGIMLVSLTGGAPFIPLIVAMAKGRIASSVGLMLLLLLATIVVMPIIVPLLFPDATVSAGDIAKSLVYSMLIPLFLALLFKARFSEIATHVQPWSIKLTNLSIVILLISLVFLYAKVMVSAVTVLPIIILFFLGATAIGYLTGGSNSSASLILSVGTGLRNPPVAILVASQYFPSEPMAAIVPLLVIIVGLSILFPWARRNKKLLSDTA